MDYLRELRLRQQTALGRLLTGGPFGEETAAAEELPRRAPEGPERRMVGREKGGSRPTAEEWDRRPRPMEEGAFRSTEEQRKKARPTAVERGERSGLPEDGELASPKKQRNRDGERDTERDAERTPAEPVERRSARQPVGRWEAFWENETFSAGGLPGLLMAERSGAAMEVEDISRAVQRDARRYDGGFTMF